MDQKLLYRLKTWRSMQAKKEGVDLFRILPNTTLDEIARVKPRTADEFLHIKGIKEGRWKKYGAMLLTMVTDSLGAEEDVLIVEETAPEIPGQKRTLYTVSDFLEALNVLFAEMTVRVKGEVSSVDTRDKTTYFTLKDAEDGSVLSCLIFKYQYDVSGVKLIVGQEVIVEGVPGVWKPTGRLSLKAQSLEVSGAGALQKAYLELKEKLEREGLLGAERKRNLPEFPRRIALITSNQGAAIGDFMMNLGKYGFKVSLLNASVEGKKAVFDLIQAVRFFNQHPEQYDVLVLIRGGGSLESLQAFNNEMLVREVAHSKIPTLCGIGHEKDVSLVALVGDMMVSTPTATAKTLGVDFEKADASLLRFEQRLLDCMRVFKERSLGIGHAFARSLSQFQFSLQRMREHLQQEQRKLTDAYAFQVKSVLVFLQQSEFNLLARDPRHLLQLGYSLVIKDGRFIKSVHGVASGEKISVQVSDGTFDAEVV